MMSMTGSRDTIAARATAPGEGGVAIVRVSGADCLPIVGRIFRAKNGRPLENRRLTYGHIVDGDSVIDEAMAVLMRAPHSYTREDVAEIQCHGSDALVRRILSLLIQADARMAQPGEFTCRAFLNGRIDLAQAEAVMRMIRADSDRAIDSAVRQLEGGVSDYIRRARERLTALLAALSAAIDFPDEVEETETAEEILGQCRQLADDLLAHCDLKRGRIEEEGLRVVLAGRPNAGKSSLLNALTSSNRAIVTDIPGTTRDTLTESILIDGARVWLTDTAGLRESGDAVEKIGVERAMEAIREADVRMLVLDASAPQSGEEWPEGTAPDIVALTKGDLPPIVSAEEAAERYPGAKIVPVCATRGEGLDALRESLAEYLPPAGGESALLSQLRHVQAARRAAEALESAARALEAQMPLDVCSIDLSAALDALGEITGETMNEQVIDEIFARFCVGK